MKHSGGLQKPFMIYLWTGICFCVIFAVAFFVNQSYIKKNTDLVRAAVAVRDVGVYAPVQPEDFRLADVPAMYAGADYVGDLDAFFEEQSWYTRELGLGQGDILRPARLSSQTEEASGLLAMIEKEHKMLVSVETTLIQSCANLVLPGVRVNAIVYIPGKDGYEITEDQMIGPDQDERLAGLLVVDKRTSEGKPLEDSGQEGVPYAMTVLLDQDEAERAEALIQYGEKGKIYLLPVGFEGEMYLRFNQGGMKNT
jgi:Flp pilus assembly protein CpaB